jgi:DNA (cytosine-5)-methyltransferase 1
VSGLIDVDTFAAAGGIDEGRNLAGHGDLPLVGIEWEATACKTAVAAGHPRIRADVSSIDISPLAGRVRLLAGGPPCPPWSAGGRRLGEFDRAACHELADRMAGGDDSTGFHEWADARSSLAVQPVRWVRDIQPEALLIENVPGAASLWEHYAEIFAGWGYSVWTGDLNAADFGVGQIRKRRLLLASRLRTVAAPVPTHSEYRGMLTLGAPVVPWVTQAEALGWGMTQRPYFSLAAGTKSGGPDGDMLGGSGARASYRRAMFTPGAWAAEPSGRTKITMAEASVLMGFRRDYPWQGGRTKQAEQLTNAVPPPLAAACVIATLGPAIAREAAA